MIPALEFLIADEDDQEATIGKVALNPPWRASSCTLEPEGHYFEHVDRALESFGTTPRFRVREFGEIVVRRALRRSI